MVFSPVVRLIFHIFRQRDIRVFFRRIGFDKLAEIRQLSPVALRFYGGNNHF